ncbi:MAG: hypothetical protein ACR2NM_17110 [Bythopirellula sp.]
MPIKNLLALQAQVPTPHASNGVHRGSFAGDRVGLTEVLSAPH